MNIALSPRNRFLLAINGLVLLASLYGIFFMASSLEGGEVREMESAYEGYLEKLSRPDGASENLDKSPVFHQNREAFQFIKKAPKRVEKVAPKPPFELVGFIKDKSGKHWAYIRNVADQSVSKVADGDDVKGWNIEFKGSEELVATLDDTRVVMKVGGKP